jgi:anti-sigma regulatory factor (Ser/Thr protein kinase)
MSLPGTNKNTVTLTVPANPVFLSLATEFVEESARVFGLDEPEALSLTLATEEIFVYLCQSTAPDKEVCLKCTGRGYYVEEEFSFQAKDFNMKAFNLTAASSIDDDGGMHETGLLIASRMVDHFRFSQQDDMLRLILLKEKLYPAFHELPVPKTLPLEEFSIREPDPEELKTFIRLLNLSYPAHLVPVTFRFPGKVVDMVASGDYVAAVATDEAGHLGGGALWRCDGPKLVEVFGPYVFNQPPDSSVAQALVESVIASVAKSSAVGVISRLPTPELPSEYFEALGSLTVERGEGSVVDIPAYYRHLEEDAGFTVWAHPTLREFLRTEYARLVFAREIRLVTDEGESSSRFSVLSAEFDQSSSQVMLRPVWWGLDSEENVAGHVRILRDEGTHGIFFEMDLGKPWHTRFAPALFDAGFEPRLVLPYAGRGDLVVFQLAGGELSR